MTKRSTKSTAKKAAKTAKKYPVVVMAVIIILVLVIVGAIFLYSFKPEVFHIYLGLGEHTWDEWDIKKAETCGVTGLRSHTCTVCGESEEEIIPPNGNHSYDDEGICGVCGFDKNFFGTAADAQEAEFSIHIIDLGEYAGDSIYIKAGENDILIDAGSRANSAPLICEYLSNYVTDGKLEYVIATHADQDHIAAFAGNGSGANRTGVLYKYDVDTLIHFDYVKKDKEANATKPNTVYGGFVEAANYLESKGTKVYTAGECYNEENGAKRQYWLDSEHTLSMNILYNYYYYNQSSDENNHSVVTLFTKETDAGRHNFLLTGDLEKDGEEKMVDYYATSSNSKSSYDVLPEVDFYKAGHHGSDTSSTAKLLNVIKPKYVAISCCAGAPEYTDNNLNTFPYQQSLENILQHTDKIYCTGQAINLAEVGADGKLENKNYDYEPLNGNITFFFNTRQTPSGTAGNVKLYCSNGFTSLTETEWFKNYRNFDNA